MSKETAKKLIAELQTNEELKAKIAGITEPAEMVKAAVEAGYDVTLEDLLEAEKEYRAETAKKQTIKVWSLPQTSLKPRLAVPCGQAIRQRTGTSLTALFPIMTWNRNLIVKNGVQNPISVLKIITQSLVF